MTVKVAINGFGRIGRCVARAIFENQDKYDIELVVINSTSPSEESRRLLCYDSVHGRFPFACEVTANGFNIAGKEVNLISERDISNIDWAEFAVDIVLECTGVFKDKEACQQHLDAGAKKVIISAPAKGDDIKTIIYGVNDDIITDADQILSVGSCTTNCLAPIAHVLHNNLEIQKGFVTTVHAYTNDQNLADNRHKDARRSRAAALSMIPTSTGAAKAISKVIPNLAGKLDGVAVRVPTPNVSMIDFTFLAGKYTDISTVNNLVLNAVKTDPKLAKVLSYETEELVSIDYNHSSFSSAFDSTGTKVLADNFVRVAAWYDNEWAFSLRMLDVSSLLG